MLNIIRAEFIICKLTVAVQISTKIHLCKTKRIIFHCCRNCLCADISSSIKCHAHDGNWSVRNKVRINGRSPCPLCADVSHRFYHAIAIVRTVGECNYAIHLVVCFCRGMICNLRIREECLVIALVNCRVKGNCSSSAVNSCNLVIHTANLCKTVFAYVHISLDSRIGK